MKYYKVEIWPDPDHCPSSSLVVEVRVAAVLREVCVREGAAGAVERVAVTVLLQ